MTVKTAICRDICDTGGGTQAFFFPELEGETPVAAWFIVSSAISDGAAANHAVLGFGAATATDERWACCATSEHNLGTTDTYRRGVTDECVLILDPTDGSVDGEADLSSFGAGTVTISWGNAPTSEYLITVIAFAGDGVSAHADTFSPHATVDNSVDVTDPGFEPDMLLLASICQTFSDSLFSYGMLSHGFAINDGSSTQGCWFWRSQDAAAAAALISRCTHTYAFLDVGSGGSVNYAVEIGSWDADGFSATSRVGGNSESDDVGYLALYFNGEVSVWGDVITSPTSTGDDSQTGPGFEPQLVMCGLTQMPSLDTTYTDGSAGCVGASAFTPDNEYSTSIADEDGADPTDTQSICNDVAVDIPQDDGSTGIRASFVSMDTNGWTWNYSDVLGSACQMFIIAIGAESSGTIIPLISPIIVAAYAPPRGGPTQYGVWLLSPTRTRLALIDRVIRLQITLTVNTVGLAEVVVPKSFPLEWVQEDSCLAIWRQVPGGEKLLVGDTLWLIRDWDQVLSEQGEESSVLIAYTENEVLDRPIVDNASGTSYASKTDYVDDMMKAIVRENFGSLATNSDRDFSDWLTVESDVSAGPSTTKAFAWRNVLTVLRELAQEADDQGNPVFFDVVHTPGTAASEFRTYIGQRGVDLSGSVVLSPRNGTLGEVRRSYVSSNERNAIVVGGQGQGEDREILRQTEAARISLSPMNRRELFVDARNAADLEAEAGAAIRNYRPRETFSAKIRDTAALRYGREYGFGCRVTAEFFGRAVSCRLDGIGIVVEQGREDIQAELRVDE